MRSTKQKALIYEIVASTKTHPTAEWVYDRARLVMPNVSLGTVYRNLKQLVECAKLQSVESEDKSVHFDADMTEHAHCVCKNCNSITDCFIMPSYPQGEFNIERQKIVYYGLCDNCVKELEK